MKSAIGWEADAITPRQHEQFGYAYDDAWNLQHRTNNTLEQTFSTDNRNQLTGASRSGTFIVAGATSQPKGGYSSWGSPPGVSNVTVSGTGLSSGAADLYLDGAWARAGATLASGNNSYTATAEDTYGRTDQDSVTVNLPSTLTFQYDGNGNLTNDGRRVFEYDFENQLTNVFVAGEWRSAFKYDAFGRRRERKEFGWNGSTWLLTNEIRYIYDGMLVVQERNGSNLPQVTYTRGRDLSGVLQGAGGIGGLLARTDNGQLATDHGHAHAFYHCDGNGNVTAMIDSNGNVVARYQYDSYGNLLGMSGPLAEANLYRFSSKEWHGNSGTYYYGYRYYEPNLQRWVNQDPLGDISSLAVAVANLAPSLESYEQKETSGLDVGRIWQDINKNIYGAMANDPVNMFDGFGLTPCSDFADSLADDFSRFPSPMEIGRDWLNRRNTTLDDSTGFKEELVGGGQGGAVSRHIYGHGGALLWGQSAAGFSPGGYAASYFQQAVDYIQRFRDGRTAGESSAEIAGDRAGRAVANALREAYRRGKDNVNLDELRGALRNILCE